MLFVSWSKWDTSPQVDKLNDVADDLNQRIVFSDDVYSEDTTDQPDTKTPLNTEDEWKIDVEIFKIHIYTYIHIQ